MDYQELILKLFAGEISDEEVILLKEWLLKNPANRKLFDEKNELWQAASINSKVNKFDVDSAWNLFSSGHEFGKRKYQIESITIFKTLAAAAAIATLLIIGSFITWNISKKSISQLSGAKIVVATTDGEKAHVYLSDSTEIILNSGTRLEYDGDYNIKDRIVRLTGEAFFIVHTNPSKPFVVLSDKVKISATGTRFNVFSFPEENQIEATLEEGAILFAAESRGTVKIKPGEQLVYHRQNGEVEVHQIRTDSYTSWKENKLRFNDTPLQEAFLRIARKYNVTFEITDINLLDLKYTGTFIDEDIEKVMELLKDITPITYKIIYRTSVTDKKYIKPKIIVAAKNKG